MEEKARRGHEVEEGVERDEQEEDEEEEMGVEEIEER